MAAGQGKRVGNRLRQWSHAIGFARALAGLQWQPSDRSDDLQDLAERVDLQGHMGLAPGARVADPLELDVDQADHWPTLHYDAVFSANTCHIMAARSVPNLIKGAASCLSPGGLLLLYGPFQNGGVHTAASNAAFDTHLRSLDPAMGVRDAQEIREWSQGQGLELIADQPMPAQNRTLIFSKEMNQNQKNDPWKAKINIRFTHGITNHELNPPNKLINQSGRSSRAERSG
jgi:hypothetical protein